MNFILKSKEPGWGSSAGERRSRHGPTPTTTARRINDHSLEQLSAPPGRACELEWQLDGFHT